MAEITYESFSECHRVAGPQTLTALAQFTPGVAFADTLESHGFVDFSRTAAGHYEFDLAQSQSTQVMCSVSTEADFAAADHSVRVYRVGEVVHVLVLNSASALADVAGIKVNLYAQTRCEY